MYLARKALEPYKEYVRTCTFSDGEYRDNCIYPIDSYPYPDSSFKIRLEFEAGSPEFLEKCLSEHTHLPNSVVDNMFDQMEFDLEDFILLADASDGTDNYSRFDGVIKRKQVPEEITLLAARTYREYKPTKDCVEFTTYVRLDIKWEE